MSVPAGRIDIYRIHIPFRMNFRHAKAERNCTENVVVRLTLADGTRGYGECVPRAYVTGETPMDVFDNLAGFVPPRVHPAPKRLSEVVDLAHEWIDFGSRCHSSNAARCALELAVLDAYGRKLGFSLSDVARHVLGPELTFPHSVRAYYSAPISAVAPAVQIALAVGYRFWRFRQLKVKIGLERETEIRTLEAIKKVLGRTVSLRADANGVWTAAEAIDWMHELARAGVEAVEEPVRPEDVGSLARVRAQTRLPVILDESLRSLDDARRAAAGALCDIFNIRISKVGGFLRALAIARFAVRNDLGFALGCQVGETSILSAAGRHFVTTVRGSRYAEGSYDSYLLKENVSRSGVDLHWGGVGDPIGGIGLGIKVRDALLEQTSELKHTVQL